MNMCELIMIEEHFNKLDIRASCYYSYPSTFVFFISRLMGSTMKLIVQNACFRGYSNGLKVKRFWVQLQHFSSNLLANCFITGLECPTGCDTCEVNYNSLDQTECLYDGCSGWNGKKAYVFDEFGGCIGKNSLGLQHRFVCL